MTRRYMLVQNCRTLSCRSDVCKWKKRKYGVRRALSQPVSRVDGRLEFARERGSVLCRWMFLLEKQVPVRLPQSLTEHALSMALVSIVVVAVGRRAVGRQEPQGLQRRQECPMRGGRKSEVLEVLN